MRQWNRILLLTVAAATFAAAQNDPPGRVGRLNYMSGPVSFQPAGVDDWVDAIPNRPLTTGDRLWTDNNARAELHIGSAALRVYSRTAFEFLNLDDANVQIRLTQGTLSIQLKRLDDSEAFEVDTPNLSFSLLRAGDYRLDVNPDTNETVIFVRGGQGEVTGGGQPFTVHPREQARVHADGNYDIVGLPPPDGWDNWCIDRDRREDRSDSGRYVSHDMVGWQDLDDNGSWRNVPDYGNVWVPRAMASDWAPYHNGHWAWIEPWGWTWVDDASWGFAPYHYGRWVNVGYWAWVPGPVAVRPVYAPALVAWVGGSGFSVGVSFGGGPGIGWFPLGPREVYVPSYRASPTYVTRVNTSNTTINNINVTNVYNTTNINNVQYVNRNVPGAVTAIPQSAMASARPVQQVAVAVQARQLQSAQVVNTAPVAPQRSSVLGRPEGNAGRVVQPPPAVVNRPVVAKTTPPPPPMSFASRQQELAKDPGRPLDAQSVQRLRAQTPVPAQTYVRPVAPANAGAPGGARRADTPVTPSAPGSPARQNPPLREVQPGQPQRVQAPAGVQQPSRVETPVQQPRNQPPTRVEQPVQQPRIQPPPSRNEPPSRVEQPVQQPRIQPPPSRSEQPSSPPRREAEPVRPAQPPARAVQPERRQDRPPEKREDKKEPKDSKDEKRKE